MEFNNADNVCIYGLKSEYNGDEEYKDKSNVLKFTNNSDNVAVFGHNSLRRGLYNYQGVIEFINTTNTLATLIAPQDYGNQDNTPTTRTVNESIDGDHREHRVLGACLAKTDKKSLWFLRLPCS